MAKRKELDKETEKVKTYGDKVRGLTQHEGWPIFREKIHKEVANLLSITDVFDQVDGNTIVQIIAAKKRASDILLKIVQDLEGTAAQVEGNASLMEKLVQDFIINEE